MSFADLPAPGEHRTDEYLLRPIRAADAELDHAAVMESREFLRIWEQSTWPEDDFSVEDNRADMEKLEQRWTDRISYSYTVMNPDETECLGCVYLFPPDVSFLSKIDKTPTADARWDDLDALLYFWVRRSRLEDGLDRRLLDDLLVWLRTDWGIEDLAVVTTEAFEQQLGVIEDAGLGRWFELVDAEQPDDRQVAYGRVGPIPR